MQLDNGKLTAEQDAFLTKLKLAQTELTKVVERLQKDAEDLKGQMRETGVARIVVRDTIHANVFVELNGVKKMMQGAIKEVILTEKDGAIEERHLE
jgi:hypothetical protein